MAVTLIYIERCGINKYCVTFRSLFSVTTFSDSQQTVGVTRIDNVGTADAYCHSLHQLYIANCSQLSPFSLLRNRQRVDIVGHRAICRNGSVKLCRDPAAASKTVHPASALSHF